MVLTAHLNPHLSNSQEHVTVLVECFRTDFMPQISYRSVAPPGLSGPGQDCT